MQTINKEVREFKGRIRAANEERDQLSNEKQDLFKKRAKLELVLKDLQEEVKGDVDAKVGQRLNVENYDKLLDIISIYDDLVWQHCCSVIMFTWLGTCREDIFQISF